MIASIRTRILRWALVALSFAAANSDAATDIAGLAAGRCAACHGTDGLSVNPQWPDLAGQKAAYLARQLRAFRDGARVDSLMSPAAAGLTDPDIAAVSAYYSHFPHPDRRSMDHTGSGGSGPAAGQTESAAVPDPRLANGRNRAAACTACHGARGISANEEWPNIGGQQAEYLARQLANFRDGLRDNVLMGQAARHLSNPDIDSLVRYFSTLEPGR